MLHELVFTGHSARTPRSDKLKCACIHTGIAPQKEARTSIAVLYKLQKGTMAGLSEGTEIGILAMSCNLKQCSRQSHVILRWLPVLVELLLGCKLSLHVKCCSATPPDLESLIDGTLEIA